MTDKQKEALINRYFGGQATDEEVISLWVLMAKDPLLAERIETEAGLRLMFPAPPDNEVNDPDHKPFSPFRWFGNLA